VLVNFRFKRAGQILGGLSQVMKVGRFALLARPLARSMHFLSFVSNAIPPSANAFSPSPSFRPRLRSARRSHSSSLLPGPSLPAGALSGECH